MKKRMIVLLVLVYTVGILGCGNQPPARIQTVKSDFKTYYELNDGTWECDGHSYKYRLEISGTMPNAAASSTFVYLSNLETISFEQAWKAAGFSSNTADYFAPEDAVLVEMKTG